MKKIAFVDDEQGILDGLRRMLRGHRDEWDMHFYISATDAISAFECERFDAIVSDMRMPHMNGAELLSKIRELSPKTLRIALSGYANEEMTLESLHATHQFIAKPADQEKVTQSINRAMILQESLDTEKIQAVLGSIDALPVLPHIYDALMAEIASEDASIDRMGDIISKDMALSSSLLKIVNSAFFGLARHVESAKQATAILGMETIKNIALSTSVFSSFSGQQKNLAMLEKLNALSQRVGVLAALIAKASELSTRGKDHAQIAGMMSNLGELIALTYSEQFVDQAEGALNTPLLGSYLLGIWSMPFPVIEAVKWHQSPAASNIQELSPLAVVHAAWSMLNMYELNQQIDLDSDLIDTGYLESVLGSEMLYEWKTVAERFCSNTEASDE